MSNERIDIESIEARMRLWAIGDVSDEDLALELDYIVPELKRCYEELDEYDKLVGLLIENHFVETSPYETIKHLIETHQDYRASE